MVALTQFVGDEDNFIVSEGSLGEIYSPIAQNREPIVLARVWDCG